MPSRSPDFSIASLRLCATLFVVGAAISLVFGAMMYQAHKEATDLMALPDPYREAVASQDSMLLWLVMAIAVVMAIALGLFGREASLERDSAPPEHRLDLRRGELELSGESGADLDFIETGQAAPVEQDLVTAVGHRLVQPGRGRAEWLGISAQIRIADRQRESIPEQSFSVAVAV